MKNLEGRMGKMEGRMERMERCLEKIVGMLEKGTVGGGVHLLVKEEGAPQSVSDEFMVSFIHVHNLYNYI